MEKYYINSNTLIILSIGNKSKVIEKYVTYYIDKTPQQIIDESCKNYGSSLKGRIDASNYLLSVKYKCPIIISETKEIIMFPTKSIRNFDCIWINFKAIDKYHSVCQNRVLISLINGEKVEINTSSRIITNQILKSSRLESILKSKKS